MFLVCCSRLCNRLNGVKEDNWSRGDSELKAPAAEESFTVRRWLLPLLFSRVLCSRVLQTPIQHCHASASVRRHGYSHQQQRQNGEKPSRSSKYLREARLHQETASDVVQPKYHWSCISIGTSLSHSMRSFATDRALDTACRCCVTVADLGICIFPASHE